MIAYVYYCCLAIYMDKRRSFKIKKLGKHILSSVIFIHFANKFFFQFI